MANIISIVIGSKQDSEIILRYKSTKHVDAAVKRLLFHATAPRMSFSGEKGVNGTIHYIMDAEYMYVCVTRDSYDRDVAFLLCGEMVDTYEEKYKQQYLIDLAEKYEDPENTDRIDALYTQVQRTKATMKDNIDQALLNRNSIPLENIEQMANEASNFQKTAKKARRKMWRKNLFWWIVLAILTAMLITSIILIIVLLPGGRRKVNSSITLKDMFTPASTHLPVITAISRFLRNDN